MSDRNPSLMGQSFVNAAMMPFECRPTNRREKTNSPPFFRLSNFVAAFPDDGRAQFLSSRVEIQLNSLIYQDYTAQEVFTLHSISTALAFS